MALTNTTLSKAASADALRLHLTSTTNLADGDVLKVNDEYMFVVDVPSSGVVDVRGRGYFGTRAKAHDILAPVTFGPSSDFQNYPTDSSNAKWAQISVGQNGAIALPADRRVEVILNKATALGSTTLADPSDAEDGKLVRIVSHSAAAHVITTVNVHDGTTGAHTTLTFAAFQGAGLTLRAHAGIWHVVANNAVTIT